MTLVLLVDVAISVIKVHETGRWAHINVKLLHIKDWFGLTDFQIQEVNY